MVRTPLLFALVVMISCPRGAVAGGESTCEIPLFHDGEGLLGTVYAYGVRLRPPYIFTGLDSDTLRLNGLPLSPRRRAGDAGAPPSPTARQKKPSPADQRVEDLGRQAAQARRDALAATKDQDAAWAAYKAVYEGAPDVESVELVDNGVRVKFRFMTHPHYELFQNGRRLFGETDVLPSPHERVVRSFWAFMRPPRLLAFGHDYDLNLGDSAAAEALAIIDSATEGQAMRPAGPQLLPMDGDFRRFWADLTSNGK